MCECVLSCFSECVLKWVRAMRRCLVGLVRVLCMRLVVFFRTHLEMGACHAKASCRSCTRVMYEHVLPKQYQRF